MLISLTCQRLSVESSGLGESRAELAIRPCPGSWEDGTCAVVERMDGCSLWIPSEKRCGISAIARCNRSLKVCWVSRILSKCSECV